MPSMNTKPSSAGTFSSMPVTIMIATAKVVIFRVEPARWIVAPSGISKSAIASGMPLRLVHSTVTGMVAAEELVPSAVM